MRRIEKEKVYRLRVIGGEMKVDDFAKSILVLVNLKSSVKETVIDVTTVENSNIVIVDSYKDMSQELKHMFNTECVEVSTLNLYRVDWCDLGAEVSKEIEELVYAKEEDVLILGE